MPLVGFGGGLIVGLFCAFQGRNEWILYPALTIFGALGLSALLISSLLYRGWRNVPVAGLAMSLFLIALLPAYPVAEMLHRQDLAEVQRCLQKYIAGVEESAATHGAYPLSLKPAVSARLCQQEPNSIYYSDGERYSFFIKGKGFSGSWVYNSEEKHWREVSSVR